MRFLRLDESGDFALTDDIVSEDKRPKYAALSHTWLAENEEVNFNDVMGGTASRKVKGFAKIRFCAEQAARDGLKHIWVDTCCINRSNNPEIQEAVISMFDWYCKADRCYALLTDVSANTNEVDGSSGSQPWEAAFRDSRWFTRGWTLQELLAPSSVEFFSEQGTKLGDRKSLQQCVHDITRIPLKALQGEPLASFPVAERLSWAEHRQTSREEDRAYSLLGIFGVFMPLIYGEKNNAFVRLLEEINKKREKSVKLDHLLATLPTTPSAAFNSRDNQHEPMCLAGTRVDLLREITQWGDGTDEKSVYWLDGIAGTGKSTIARTVAKHYHDEGNLGGSFFFSRGGGDASHADRLFTTLASQLANNISATEPHICDALMVHKDIAQRAYRDQWEQLIINPLAKAHDALRHSTLVLVLDALDECDSEREIRIILGLLPMTKKLRSVRLRIFITSRPDASIRRHFQRIAEAERQEFRLHDIAPTLIDQDLTLFFEDRLTNIREECELPLEWPGGKTIARLVDISSGLFIWASTACRYIGDGGQFAKDRVNRLLKGHHTDAGPEKQLDEIYLTVLQDSIRSGYEKDEKAEMYSRHRKIIGAIVVLLSPLSLDALAKLLDILPEHVTATLENLHAIMNIPQERGRSIRVHHPSFRDFLLNKERCSDRDFWIDESEAHKRLGKDCVRLMSTMLKQDMCGIKSPGVRNQEIEHALVKKCVPPELHYGCLYWAEHYRQGGIHVRDDDDTDHFYRKHFLHWLEALSLIRESAGMAAITRMYQSLLSYADNTKQLPFVKDSRRLIVGFQSRIEEAPLQVYSTALVFSKHSNQLRHHFWTQMIPLIRYVSVVSADAPEPKDDYNYVNNLAFTPDGKELASGSIDEWVRVWDVPNMTVLTKYQGQDDKISSVAISPDGSLLASGSDDSTIRLWNMRTKATHCVLTGHNKWVNTVTFSPDGKFLASGSMDETIRLWDTANGKELDMLELNLSCINALAFSADGMLLASGTVGPSIPLWDLKNEKLRVMLEGHSGPVNSVEFSQRGERLVSGSDDMTVRVWDVVAGTEIKKLTGHTKKVWAVTFSRDKHFIASGSEDGTARLWNAETGDSLSVLEGHTSGINAVVYSPDEHLLASCSFNDEVRLWDAKTGETRGKLPDFDEDGNASAPLVKATATSEPKQDMILADHQRGHADTVTCLAFSPNGQLVASGSDDTTLKIWTMEGVEQHELADHTDSITCITFSPKGHLLVSASKDTTVKLWDPVSGKLACTLEGHSGEVHLVRFSSDGRFLASCSVDNTVRLWDTRSGEVVSTLARHSDTVNDIAFSPNDRSLASCSDDTTICLWRVRSATMLLADNIHAHIDSVSSIAFSPDGKLLVSSSSDKTVKVWDMDGNLRCTFEGHTLPATSAAFSRDGQRLASSSEDETIRIWSLSAGSEEKVMGMGVVVRAVSFSSCGRFMETDRGWVAVGSSPQDTALVSRALFVTENWVKCDQNNALWLLEDYHAASVATWNETTVLGHLSGAISFIGF